MRSFALASALAAIHAVSATPTQTEKELPRRAGTLPVISASGNAFYADGQRFFVRGIDYQPGGSSANIDPLADIEICGRDIPKFEKLGVNSIRVYSVDNSVNHDACMKMLDEAGIYLVLDVNNPKYSINRADPKPSYNSVYLQSVFATVQEFAKYDNTMAFFSGNEVINDEPNTTVNAPYMKAITRDMKAFMAARGLRAVPVGYSAADVSQNRMQTAHYMNCGPDNSRGDFFAMNDYSWCNTDFATAGWGEKVKNFTDYGVPLFLSEYGCTANGRDFNELEALMSDLMTSVYSGGLMYEYTLEGNAFGIVSVDGNTVEEHPEFAKLSMAMSKFPAPTGAAGASPTSHSNPCPTSDAVWEVDPTLVPVMPEEAQKFFDEGAGVGPGLLGEGSQNSGSGTSPGDTTEGAPSSTPTDNAAAGGLTYQGSIEKGPLLVTGLTVAFTIFGAFML